MLIYKEEQILAKEILSNNSIAYHCEIEECDKLPERAVASVDCSGVTDVNFRTPQTNDLFYTRSVLVSTSVNLNGDHFSPTQTWAARKTPIDKPTNINHDQNKIIGHITSQWAIDNNGILIPDDTVAEDLPDFFHIANGSVIYAKFPGEEEMQDQVDFLIAEIQAGEKFVSMECLFSDFQYAVEDGDNKYIVGRNEETSFLTKHLRAYGGSGEFDGMKIYRSLMNINFSGKGFVDKPANKDSVIFAKDQISEFSFAKIKASNPFSKASGVYFNCKANTDTESQTENNMPDAQIKELEKTIASLQKQIAEADTKALEAQIQELEKSLEDAAAKVTEVNEKLDKEQEAKACMCDQVEKVAAENEKLKTELNKLQTEATQSARVKAFIDKGFTPIEAQSEVKELSALDDKTFAFVVSKVPAKAETEAVAPKSLDDSTAEVEIEEVGKQEEKTEASVDSTEVDSEMVARASLIKGIRAQFANTIQEEESK